MQERYILCHRRAEQSKLISEMVDVLNIQRKSVLRLLHKKKHHRVVARGRKVQYNETLTAPLTTIWKALGCPCAKKVVAQISEMIAVLERFHELYLLPGQKDLLCTMSNFTVNALLKRERKDPDYYGLSGTKTSPLLKTLIPIRTEFNEVHAPGHIEMDCVLHCGESLSGQYAETLNLLDIHTHWNEKSVFLDKTRAKVISTLHVLRKQFPFPLRSVDFDNGFEFVNWRMYNYCTREKLLFTRSRSYHKNDQAHIEGKNFQSVRKLIGYERISNSRVVQVINDVYSNEHRLLTNFFYPTFKLREKERIGTKIIKHYEIPQTPYQRVLKSTEVSPEEKQRLIAIYATLNPLQLQRNLHKKLIRIKQVLGNTNYLATTTRERIVG